MKMLTYIDLTRTSQVEYRTQKKIKARLKVKKGSKLFGIVNEDFSSSSEVEWKSGCQKLIPDPKFKHRVLHALTSQLQGKCPSSMSVFLSLRCVFSSLYRFLFVSFSVGASVSLSVFFSFSVCVSISVYVSMIFFQYVCFSFLSCLCVCLSLLMQVYLAYCMYVWVGSVVKCLAFQYVSNYACLTFCVLIGTFL